MGSLVVAAEAVEPESGGDEIQIGERSRHDGLIVTSSHFFDTSLLVDNVR